MRPGRLKASAAELAHIAGQVVPDHAGWIASGYQIGGKSGLWLTKSHTITARLVYRKKYTTIVFCIREIPLEYAHG